MADLAVQIFTFTATESAAVDSLLETIEQETGAALSGRAITVPRPGGGGNALIRHKPLSAQGNVIAGTALAGALVERAADYYIFYGCCGVVEPSDKSKIFRVASVSYLSLGVVRPAKNETEQPTDDDPDKTNASDGDSAATAAAEEPEVVKLKNKWIVETTPSDQSPLPKIDLPAGAPGQPGTVNGLGVADAHVLATDKVINVPPAGEAPAPSPTGGGSVYPKGEWTYAQALAQYTSSPQADGPVLIDMESFGIASTARAFGRDERVLVLRVATDALTDKEKQSPAEQERLLVQQLPALSATLQRIIDSSG